MICHGFKGGIGTSSRVVEDGLTVGVLVQANHGRRPRLRVNGVPVGERIDADVVPLPARAARARLDHRGGRHRCAAAPAPVRAACATGRLGIGRTGGMGEHSSGDFAICFATGNRALAADEGETPARGCFARRPERRLFEAVIDATEEAILNACSRPRR